MQFSTLTLLALATGASAQGNGGGRPTNPRPVLDLGTWSLYCGAACSNGTLIASGDVSYPAFGACAPLAEAYDFCYLECDGECDQTRDTWYEAVTFRGDACSRSGSAGLGQLQPGQCVDGPWESYFVKLNL